LTTAYEGPYGGNRKFLGYQAQVDFRFMVVKLETVEAVLSDAVTAGANEVRRVKYQTTRLRDLRAEARREAVVAARRKAEIYAEAANTKLGAVLHIEDVNPDASPYRGHTEARSPEEDAEETSAGLRSGSLVISAAVMITFALLQN